jgi:hypothetical protein
MGAFIKDSLIEVAVYAVILTVAVFLFVTFARSADIRSRSFSIVGADAQSNWLDSPTF